MPHKSHSNMPQNKKNKPSIMPKEVGHKVGHNPGGVVHNPGGMAHKQKPRRGRVY